jgi:hypothetical protein
MLSDWVSFLVYPNLFEIKGFVVVVDSCLVPLLVSVSNLVSYVYVIFFFFQLKFIFIATTMLFSFKAPVRKQEHLVVGIPVF